MGKEIINNKIVINEAGEDKIKLSNDNKNGVWYAEIVHNCKSVGAGITYLLEKHEDIKTLLDTYNKVEDC